MTQKFISGNHGLEPVWPSPGFPASILRTAETLSFRAGKLTGLLPDNTAIRIGGLMRITNSYYSNLIEGQFTEPATLSARVPIRGSKELRELAESHIGVQQLLERVVRRPKSIEAPWGVFFAPESVTPMLKRLQQVYGGQPDLTSRILSTLAYHHRLAFVHAFEDGNGRVVRMMTHLQLMRLGLASPRPMARSHSGDAIGRRRPPPQSKTRRQHDG